MDAHLATKGHKKNASDLAIGVRKSSGHYSHKFSSSWTIDRRFRDWIKRTPDCYEERHVEKERHRDICIERNIATANEIPPEVVQESVDSFKQSVLTAELDYARLGAELSIPFKQMGSILNFFKKIETPVLQKMTAGATKVSGIVRNVLGSYEEECSVEMLKRVKFSIFIDEGTQNNKSWLTFLVRYVDPETLDGKTALSKLLELDASKLDALGIFGQFKHYMLKHSIPFANILAMACDNASVMLGDRLSFKALLLKENPNVIIILCICHSLALVAKHSCEKTMPSIVEESMMAIIDHQNYAKRSQIFSEFIDACQGLDLKYVKYVVTRWLIRGAAIKRFRLLMPSAQACFADANMMETNAKKLEKLEKLNAFLNDPEMHAYMAFLEYVLEMFNNINIYFQHSETRVHLLHEKCLQFFSLIVRHFLKKPLLSFLTSGKIRFNDPDNHLALEDNNLGEECNDIVKTISEKNNSESKEIVCRVRETCKNFYIEAATQIQQRLFFIQDEFFTSLRVFDSRTALNDTFRDLTLDDVWVCANKFGGFEKAALKKE
ncbi:uncharacterized protein LOC117177389 [Belonocnema kinseyi]|uniref:uncharacterized protein LOC117177389 n=1 Tax=Belonocnema kinseyi TaxID=2817044 RepID=UPI00143D1283|nr:uncharacterized protein LOC117177389 [Belonocnema kinseyi]